jgi:hypothetical protein
MIWTCDTWIAKACMGRAGARGVLADGGPSRVELKAVVSGDVLAYLPAAAPGSKLTSLRGNDVKAIALNLNEALCLSPGAVAC